ncbi:MAG: M43 family zinc metalloprotease, partial [Flavobacteriales bacterium]
MNFNIRTLSQVVIMSCLPLLASPQKKIKTKVTSQKGNKSIKINRSKKDAYEKYRNHEPCKTAQRDSALKATDPQFRKGRKNAEKAIKKILKNKKPKSKDGSRGSVYTIPVVFHVIHKGSSVGNGVNISKAQVESAIPALNRDFRATSDDGGIAQGTNSTDTEIEFCLAKRDTNVNRVDGTSVTGYDSNGITSSNEVDVKDLSRWPNTDYLNVWVVSEIDDNNADLPDEDNWSGGTVGYAYHPTDPVTLNSDKDGIVVLNLACGNDPDDSEGYRLWTATMTNRTLTHEAGHYLDLYHTFKGESCSETDCFTDGDKICDTPPTKSGNTCSSQTCTPTLEEDYMDYTEESCQNTYTDSQKIRMRAAITGPRSDLLNSDGCNPVYTYDVGISNILHPTSTICGDTLIPEVVLKNFGDTTITSVDILYNIDGGSNQSYSWSGSIASNEKDTVLLNSMTTSSGSHTFYARTDSTTLNGSNSDEYTANDLDSASFNVKNGNQVNYHLETDCFGSDVTWELRDSSNTVFSSGGPYSDSDSGTTVNKSYCLSDGCYTFKIYDSYSDGLAGAQYNSCTINGSYKITNENGDTLAYIGPDPDYGDSATHNFCIPKATIDSVHTTDVTCAGGSDGEIEIFASGNSLEYSIDGGSNYQSSNLFSNLTAGTYNIKVRDGSGNTDTTSVTLNEPAPISIDFSITDASCNGSCDGAINTTISGGSSPYTVSWSDGTSTKDRDSLCEGYYSISVEDADGCTASKGDTVFDPAPLSLSFNITDETCGNSNGEVEISASGGTSPYQYSFDGGAFDTTSVYSSLSAGDYVVAVEDSNGCTFKDTATVNNITGPTGMTFSVSNETCGNGNGQVEVTGVTGGTSPYTYSFEGGAFDTTTTYSNLSSGTYTMTVKDDNGCTYSDSSIIVDNEPGPTAMSYSITDETCNNSDGAVDITGVTGGTSPYQYSFDGSGYSSTTSYTGLSSGTYAVSVKDSNGCEFFDSVSVGTIAGPSDMSFSVADETCGDGNGKVEITGVTGGTTPYEYSFDGGTFDATTLYDSLSAGTYSVEVKDSNG